MSQKKDMTAQDYLQKAGNVSLEYLNIFKNKLATTMVDTVYMAENITKTVLPGNPVTREYEVVRHIGSAGPGLLWKLYAGYKKSTKQEACVFVLQKKSLESYSKRDRDQIVDAFKKGATQLARIKHPRILSLQHQLEESKDSLAFATEPCFCSVANALGNHENMPAPLPPEFTDYKLFEVEIKYGLMQIAEGLNFLHKDVKILHRNIWPGSIVINSNGAWKLACFEMFVANCNDPNDPIRFPFKEWDGSVACVLNPELDYLAPEYGLNSKCDTASDMFSYGMLFYTVFNNGKSLYNSDYNYSTYINNVEELRKMTNSKFGSIPSDVREYLKLLMHINPELRPDAGQVMKIPFFDDVAVKTLEYLDSSFQVDNLQKSIFFKSLPQIIDKLPQRVCLQRIIPCLEQEFINPEMIPFLLPNIFLIAQQSSNDEYVKYVLPRLKIIFKIQKPIQILLIVLRNMGLILSKTPPTEIKEHILPMVCRSLEAETIEIQELCLSSLPTFANMLDTQSIKLQFIPRIRKLCLESPSVPIRVNSLICLGKLLDFLEKWIVLDDILPILEKVTVRDSGVLMAMLGIWKVALTHPKLGITKDILATRVLPTIIPILIDGNLNMNQFTSYMTVTKEMLAQIETEQKRKLEQIEALEREKSIIPYAMANPNSSKPVAEVYKGPETMMDQLITGYGLNKQQNNGNAPPPGYQGGNAILGDSTGSGSQQHQVKKQLTLSEKQEMASRLEKEFGDTSPSKGGAMSSSMSLSTIKTNKPNSAASKDLLTDSLMDRNLADMNINAKSNSQFQQFTPQNNNFNMMNNNNNNINNNNKPSGGGFNQFNSQIRPNSMNSMMNNQQMGFFGNLALPAPPSANSTQTMNGMNMNSGLNSMKPMSMNMMSTGGGGGGGQQVMAPTLIPPPPQAANRSPQQQATPGKKTALDDLQDIFG